MISFHHRSSDSYGTYGIEHFFRKYGIPVDVNPPQPSRVSIGYGIRSPGENFSILIRENEILDGITGSLEAQGKKAPLFEVPSDTGDDGLPLAFYSSGALKYPCMSVTEAGIIIGFDLFKETGRILSGSLDKVREKQGTSDPDPFTSVPLVDFYESQLFDAILRAYKRAEIPLVLVPFWPDGKKFAVCLTHDVDEVKKTYQWLTYPVKLIKRGNFKGLTHQFSSLFKKLRGKEPYWTFDELIPLEERLGVVSSYFFLQENARVRVQERKTWKHMGRRYRLDDPAVKQVLETLQLKGHDIGLHGSYDSYLDAALLSEEKKELEKILSGHVYGTRQHNLNFRFPDTLLIQEKAGLLYDSTLGFNNTLGFRWGTCFPFYPFDPKDQRGLNILEIPLVIQDTVFFRYQDPWGEFLKLVKEIQSYQGVLTLLWHHAVFNDDEFPGWGPLYSRIIEFCKQQGAWVTNGREIAEWWKGRESIRIKAEFDGFTMKIRPIPGDHDIAIYLPGPWSVEKITNAGLVEFDHQIMVIRPDDSAEGSGIEIQFSGTK